MSHWEEKYRAKTIPWDRGAVSPALLGWIEDGALPPGRILIPGCGRGHEAVELARRGFQVTALDIAPTALEHLAAELAAAGVEAERVCADALTWQPAQPFDAIYEQTCLCALDPDALGGLRTTTVQLAAPRRQVVRAVHADRARRRPTVPLRACRTCARCLPPHAGNGRKVNRAGLCIPTTSSNSRRC